MVEVRLHGALAAKFGRVWNLDISTPAEAVAAIECGRPGFRKAILDLDEQGMVFRVRSKTHDYDNDDVATSLGSTKRIDIIPIVRGASAGVRFVVGAVLTVAGFIVSGAGFQLVGYAMMSAGVSLMIGAVVEWLTPVPKREDIKNAQSWTLSGPVNTVDQGVPVPIIYGEVLTGSHPISAGISAAQVAPSGALAAEVAIGGRIEQAQTASYGNTGDYTNVFLLSASPFNLTEPFTYSWSKTGFTGFVTRMTQVDEATVRLEVDHFVDSLSPNSATEGTVSLTMSGKDIDGNTVNASTSVLVKSSVNYIEPVLGD